MYFCYVHSLWKCQLKYLSHSGDIFRYIFCMLMKENLWTLRYMVLCLSLVSSVHFLLMFSGRFWNHKKLLQVFVIVTSRKLSYLFSFSNSIVYCIDGSWLFRMSKNCNDCSLVLSLAWLSSTNLLKVFGVKGENLCYRYVLNSLKVTFR